MKSLLKCVKCGKYSLKDICSCMGNSLTPKPAKFSPDDKYAVYRRKAKLDSFKEEGLL